MNLKQRELQFRQLSAPYQGPGIGVGPLVQEQFGDPVVAAVSGHMQRCQVIQRDIVDGSLVLQKVLDTFHVVALCRHVKRGEAILECDLEKLKRGRSACVCMCVRVGRGEGRGALICLH